MAIFLTADSRIMIQGITGGEGRKHGARMLAAGSKVVGGTNPKKAGTTVELNGEQVPVFAGVKETIEATGADVSVIFVPAAGTKAAVMADSLEIVLSDPAVRSVFVNVFGGITACDAVANGIVSALGLLAERLWTMFAGEDATLVEVNPMALTLDGQVLAVDGKVTLDDNAAFRHQHARFDDVSNIDPIEARAREKHLNYVKLDGAVGIIGNGAGLVMSTLDVVAYAGQEFGGIKPANFLDIGGGASAEVMANGLEIVLSDPSVRSVFVNVFGGITSCDAVANGIVSGIGLLESRGDHVDRPIVVRLDGNNAAEGRQILADAAIAVVEQVPTMDGAARRSAELASTASKGA